jgi:DNA-directed RNA polymerase alpha subunit
VVYSGDLESSDPLIIPINSRIPIVTMKRGQKLKFEAIVKLGKGRWHAKWQPVSGLRYSYTPIYEVLPEALPESCKNCESLEKNRDGVVVIRDPYSCPKCAAELERMLNSGDSRVQVKWDDTRIFIGFESNGQLPPFRIILAAADELIKKFDEFESKQKKALSSNKG